MRSPSKVGGIHPEGPHVTSRACEARRQGRFRARKPNVGNLSRPTRRCTSDRSLERYKHPLLCCLALPPAPVVVARTQHLQRRGRSGPQNAGPAGGSSSGRPARHDYSIGCHQAVGHLKNKPRGSFNAQARAQLLRWSFAAESATVRNAAWLSVRLKNVSSYFHSVRKQPLPTKA